MSARYLVDTNIISDLIRNPQGRCAVHFNLVGLASIATSIIVASELRHGAARRRSPVLVEKIETILQSIKVCALESPSDREYSTIRTVLEQKGTPIGANDLLIAAHARALHMILVTDNTKEFKRVPGLKLENWLR